MSLRGSNTVWERDVMGGFFFTHCFCKVRGQDSSVGIATGYGLDGPGIESRWGEIFRTRPRPALGHTQPPVFSGGKAVGAWC
jgi:hypothetical protein